MRQGLVTVLPLLHAAATTTVGMTTATGTETSPTAAAMTDTPGRIGFFGGSSSRIPACDRWTDDRHRNDERRRDDDHRRETTAMRGDAIAATREEVMDAVGRLQLLMLPLAQPRPYVFWCPWATKKKALSKRYVV
jgi:hypothetical protein